MITQLYQRRADGSIAMKNLHRGMFSDQDAHQEAIDFWQAKGWVEREELPEPPRGAGAA